LADGVPSFTVADDPVSKEPIIMGSGIIIIIGGLHGTGKSTCARMLAEKLHLKYVSAGELFRDMAKKKGMSIEDFSRYAESHHEVDKEVDSRVVQASEKGNAVIEGQIAAGLVGKPDITVFLTAPERVRIERLSYRDRKSNDEILIETKIREESERRRYMELYRIDVHDFSSYNLVIDTSKWSAEAVTEIIRKAAQEYMKEKLKT
jgi:cytidylate kinase